MGSGVLGSAVRCTLRHGMVRFMWGWVQYSGDLDRLLTGLFTHAWPRAVRAVYISAARNPIFCCHPYLSPNVHPTL